MPTIVDLGDVKSGSKIVDYTVVSRISGSPGTGYSSVITKPDGGNIAYGLGTSGNIHSGQWVRTTLQGSNDKSTWTDIASVTSTVDGSNHNHTKGTHDGYKYYRIYYTGSSSGSGVRVGVAFIAAMKEE